jgi:hypothetical protein
MIRNHESKFPVFFPYFSSERRTCGPEEGAFLKMAESRYWEVEHVAEIPYAPGMLDIDRHIQ